MLKALRNITISIVECLLGTEAFLNSSCKNFAEGSNCKYFIFLGFSIFLLPQQKFQGAWRISGGIALPASGWLYGWLEVVSPVFSNTGNDRAMIIFSFICIGQTTIAIKEHVIQVWWRDVKWKQQTFLQRINTVFIELALSWISHFSEYSQSNYANQIVSNQAVSLNVYTMIFGTFVLVS